MAARKGGNIQKEGRKDRGNTEEDKQFTTGERKRGFSGLYKCEIMEVWMDGCGGREEGGKEARKSTEEGGNDEGRCVVTVNKGGGGDGEEAHGRSGGRSTQQAPANNANVSM